MTDEKNTRKTRKQGDRGKANVAYKRRMRLWKLLQKIGAWGFDKKLIAEKENVSLTTIEKDTQWLKKHVWMDKIDTEDTKYEISNGLKSLMTQARTRSHTSPDDRDKRGWSHLYGQHAERITKFYQEFGIMSKAPEKIEVKQVLPEDFHTFYENYKKIQVKK